MQITPSPKLSQTPLSLGNQRQFSSTFLKKVNSEYKIQFRSPTKPETRSNADKLKQKLTDIQKLCSEKGRQEYIKMKLDEKKTESIFEKIPALLKTKPLAKHKIYDDKNVLKLINKKNKQCKLLKPSNEKKFNAKIDVFRKITSFIDMRKMIRKMNILEDEDFKEFLDSTLLKKDLSKDEDEDFIKEKFAKDCLNNRPQEPLTFVNKPKHRILLQKIHQKIAEVKLEKDLNSDLSKQLMNSLQKNEELQTNEEFYPKIDEYLSNERLMFSSIGEILTENNTTSQFSEHKKSHEATRLQENYQAFKEIQEIKGILKTLGINLSEKEKFESSYSTNYSQLVSDFRKTLRNVSLEVLKKSMEDFSDKKDNRRYGLLGSSEKMSDYRLKTMKSMDNSNQNSIDDRKYDKANQTVNDKTLNMKSPLSNEKRNTSEKILHMKSSFSNSIKNTNESLMMKTNESLNKNSDFSSKKTMENTIYKKFMELSFFKPKKKIGFFNKSPMNKPLNSSEEIKTDFNFKKYHDYLGYANRNINKEWKGAFALKYNLSKTIDWFVQDIMDLEKKSEDEMNGRNEKLKGFGEEIDGIREKHQEKIVKLRDFFND